MENCPSPATDTERAAHALLSTGLALRLAGRLPPARTLKLYVRALGVPVADTAWLHTHAVRNGAQALHERSPAADPGLLRFRDWLRFHAAPHGDAQLQREVEAGLEDCRRAIQVLRARLDARRRVESEAQDREAVGAAPFAGRARQRTATPAAAVAAVPRLVSSRTAYAPPARRAASTGPSR
jgi:hypothetical protein